MIIGRLRDVGDEYGIKVVPVNEAYISVTCSLCGEVHDGGRVFRGLFKCPNMGKAMNADINGAINILHSPKCPQGIGVIWLEAQPLVYH